MTTIAILGDNFNKTTEFVNKIIHNTKAKIDQEHLKMNIIIDNKLLEKSKQEIITILNELEDIDSSYLVLTFNNEVIYNIIKDNTILPIINKDFNIENNDLIQKIISLKEVN